MQEQEREREILSGKTKTSLGNEAGAVQEVAEAATSARRALAAHELDAWPRMSAVDGG